MDLTLSCSIIRDLWKVQHAGDFLHRFTFGEQLEDFALTRRQLAAWMSVIDVLQRFDQAFSHQRRDVRPPQHDFADGRQQLGGH